MNATRRNLSGHRRAGIPSALVVLGITVPAGYGAARLSAPLVHDRYFPWILGRTLGLSAYAALGALVMVGLWMRHPWRQRWPVVHPESSLRLHASLGAAVVVLAIGHVVSLASDRYAGVGWIGTIVPDASTYRPLAVTLGVIGFDAIVMVAATAALGGRLIGRHWLVVHRLALPAAGLVWLHGLLAGTDAPRLRVLYALSGAVMVVMVLSRAVARKVPLLRDTAPSVGLFDSGSRQPPATGVKQ